MLKLYPQADGDASAVEASVLSAVDGALPVPAPLAAAAPVQLPALVLPPASRTAGAHS